MLEILATIFLGFFGIVIFSILAQIFPISKVIAIFVGLYIFIKIICYFPSVLAVTIVIFLIYVCIADKPPPLHHKRDEFKEVLRGLDEMSLIRKEKEINRLKYEIDDLERERDSLTTKSSTIFGSNGLSESELEYNRRKRDELNREIDSKKYELNQMEIELDLERRSLVD